MIQALFQPDRVPRWVPEPINFGQEVHEQMSFRHLKLLDVSREPKEPIPCIKTVLTLCRCKGESSTSPQQDDLFEMSAGCQELCPDIPQDPDSGAQLVQKEKQETSGFGRLRAQLPRAPVANDPPGKLEAGQQLLRVLTMPSLEEAVQLEPACQDCRFQGLLVGAGSPPHERRNHQPDEVPAKVLHDPQVQAVHAVHRQGPHRGDAQLRREEGQAAPSHGF